MSLINCPECTREISDKAESCPHCGYPIVNQPSEPEAVKNVVIQESAPKNSKKKSIAILSAIAVAIITLIIIITSSGDTTGTKPEDMSDEYYQYGKSVLEIVDQYLDHKITAEDALNRIDVLQKSSNHLPQTERDDKNHSNNFYVESAVTHLDYTLSSHRWGSKTLSDLLEARNRLAEILNEKAK